MGGDNVREDDRGEAGEVGVKVAETMAPCDQGPGSGTSTRDQGSGPGIRTIEAALS